MQNPFLDDLKKVLDRENPNVSVTENGAVGYKTTGHALLDMNFMLSSLRDASEPDIWQIFLRAFNETPVASVLWLFFARDVRGGCGERRVFRAIMSRLAVEYPSLAAVLLKHVAEYGRWDDLWHIVPPSAPEMLKAELLSLVSRQINDDLRDMRAGKPISLLAKWLPSANTSSAKTRRRAIELQRALGYSPRQYRRLLSSLRSHIDVVERRMSARKWENIRYSAVPSRAMLIYGDAFRRHDPDRYEQYLSDVTSGKEKINAATLFPHDIVHAYMENWWGVKPLDHKLEAQWKALPDTVPDGAGTLVVIDGSGSMGSPVGGTKVSAHDVARAIGIYFSERLKGPYRDSFITFSENPQLIHFAPGLSLHNKLELLEDYDECSNTDIGRVFDLVLKTAVQNRLSPEELPANILIISDMEFDMASATYGSEMPDKALFEHIADKWASAGYKLPRLAFWNVASRTGTIPVTSNENGVALVSGFSPSIADMVMSAKLDPWDCLMDKLLSDRYRPILEEVRSLYE